MHISLTPELEIKIKQNVASGFYNNASEVIRDVLRFWEKNEELVQHMKLEMLKKRLSTGADQVPVNSGLGRQRPEISPGYYSFPSWQHIIFYLKSDHHIDKNLVRFSP